MNSKRKRTYFLKWKEWKSKMIYFLKSILKLNRLTIKSKRKSMLLDKITPWKETELPTKKINQWKNSRKFSNQKDLTHLLSNKEWEIEVDQNLWSKSRKNDQKKAMKWWIKRKKEKRKSEAELDRPQDLEAKGITEKLQSNRYKAKRLKTNLPKNGELWTKKESQIDLSDQKCQSIYTQEKPARVPETGDEINIFLHAMLLNVLFICFEYLKIN